MDKFIYFLTVPFALLFLIFVFYKRPDLRRKVIVTSLLGGLAGILGDIWFSSDYWHPPALLRIHSVALEDMLVAALCLTAVPAVLYDVIFRQTAEPTGKSHRKIFLGLFLFGLAGLIFLSNFLKINSVLVSSFLFLCITVIMIFIQRDLLRPAVMSGLLFFAVIFPSYFILFDILSPQYWQHYWYLYGTPLGKMIFGIPLTELLWDTSWGIFAGIAYDFVRGNRKMPLNSKSV